MELRQLRYFIVVAEELNFGRAAKRLRIAGPSLSQQIRVLERNLRVPLFERDRRSVTLTPTGAALLPAARALVDQADLLRRRAIGLSDSDPVRLGYVDWLPANLFERTAAVANVHIDTWVLPSHTQVARVAEGGIDLAICWVQPPELDEYGLEARVIGAQQLQATAVSGDGCAVAAADTVVLLDSDSTSWSSWNRYGELFSTHTGAQTVHISDGGIAGAMFFQHVRRLGRPVLNSPKAQNATVPANLMRRTITPPAPYWTWSLVSRGAEAREAVRSVFEALTTGIVLPDLTLGWLPTTEPER
ncbi:LysR family transcriptional regulator [Mycobacterium sp. 1482292.6]|uniref:LysR family transcriptional regulator n=1 Tax=Mycobacterium sp. 1482292.6 TaxID=1834081 RepID=UPI00080073BC|nr:LysR family transcriptional regulator [Mycobacterium sp. 1482292.6]OBJ12688.1 LysR family transcriptional regulator [Mycobacterium sp. 1482292.6]